MKCKVCGAYNEDYLEYCKNCAEPLTPDAKDTSSEKAAADKSSAPNAWSFVNSPTWSKPDFSANSVSEDDVPEEYLTNEAEPGFSGELASASNPASVPPRPGAAKLNSVRTYANAVIPCPKCGSPLADGQRFCNTCGAKLAFAPAAASASYAQEQPAQTPSPAAAIRYADPIDESMFSYHSDQDEDAPSPPRRSSGKSRGHSRKRKNNSPLFWIVAGVLIVAIVVLGSVLIAKNVDFGSLFSKSPITKDVVVEPTTTSTGEAAYNITVFAKKNSTVHFEGGSIVKESPVTGKSITLCIPEQVWIPSEPVDGATVEIYPDVTVIAKDGTEYPVVFYEPIIITVPTLTLTVTSPNTPSFTADSLEVPMSGVIDDTTASVYVNDVQLTVDETGKFESTYTLPSAGTNTVNVEARKNGYAIARQTFDITYTASATQTNLPSSTNTNTGAATSAATLIAYANTDKLNVRSEPSSDGTKLGTLALCQKVYVIESDVGNDWSKIIYNNTEAYASKVYLNSVGDPTTYITKTATVNTDNLNARSTDSSSGTVVTKLANGTKVSYIKDMGSDWSMIEYNEQILFVATNYLTIS